LELTEGDNARNAKFVTCLVLKNRAQDALSASHLCPMENKNPAQMQVENIRSNSFQIPV
jgi:hypothetical protein